MKRGFTLIEMVTVIAILAILLIIAMMSWRNHINKANDARRKDDLQRLSIAFEEYYSDEECYPVADILQTCGGNSLNPYLDKIPCDPVYDTPYCYITDADNPTCYRSFKLLAPLQNLADIIIAKLGCGGDQSCGYETECADPGRLIDGYNYGVSSGNVSVANPNLPQPSPSASAAPASAMPSPHPGGGAYIYACDRDGICNSWDHFPLGCYFFDVSTCDSPSNPCSNSSYWCNE